MPTVSFTHLGQVTAINPGTTHHWWWNNAPAERVWAFSVDAMIPLTIPPSPGDSARVEVTRVEYRENYDGSRFEKEIHFWIKNTGAKSAKYAIHMATIRE